jgi:hypothetical protein
MQKDPYLGIWGFGDLGYLLVVLNFDGQKNLPRM